MKKEFSKTIKISIWTSFLIVSFLFYYSNHYFPEGPKYPTGDMVCQYDDRGKCVDEYKEDVSGLNIPGWAKFFKGSGGELLFFALFVASVVMLDN